MPKRTDFRGIDRRWFIRTSAVTSVGLFSTGFGSDAFARTPKKILAFGGTDFVGPALVNALMADGHTVTIFDPALAAGWQTRPFAETAFDALSDFYSGQSPRPNYLTAAREKEVLEAWKH